MACQAGLNPAGSQEKVPEEVLNTHLPTDEGPSGGACCREPAAVAGAVSALWAGTMPSCICNTHIKHCSIISRTALTWSQELKELCDTSLAEASRREGDNLPPGEAGIVGLGLALLAARRAQAILFHAQPACMHHRH